MSNRNIEPQPAVRKSFLIVAGAAIGAALLGFVLMTFVFGGGGGGGDEAPTDAATQNAPAVPQVTPSPTPEPDDDGELTPGGRDPFTPQSLGTRQLHGVTLAST